MLTPEEKTESPEEKENAELTKQLEAALEENKRLKDIIKSLIQEKRIGYRPNLHV